MNDEIIGQKYIIEFDRKSNDSPYYRVAGTMNWFSEETVKKLPLLESGELMGYPLKELAIFATACRQQNISNTQLGDFLNDLRAAYKVIMSDVRERIGAALDATIKLDKEYCKTGEWVLDEKLSKENFEHIYFCSACRNYEVLGDNKRTRFCPYCGARMVDENEIN